ncbi:nucleotide disphospho-sugar-binding domain-containing protein [Micromonospora sediminicola]|uniref:glycosyltransferase n=1 Tax=Micromonospora sediminicola TaxID=946078 RepID=UPI0033EF61A0
MLVTTSAAVPVAPVYEYDHRPPAHQECPMRVLFTTAPLHGHFFPLVPLGWAFRALGHEVLVATSDHFVAAAGAAGLPAVATGHGMHVRDLCDPEASLGIEDAPYAHGRVFAQMASRNLNATIAVLDRWRPDLVVSERSEFAGPIAAATRRIPRVELQWGVAELKEYRDAAAAELNEALIGLGIDVLPRPAVVLDPWPPALRLEHARANTSIRHVPYNGREVVFDWMHERRGRPVVCLTLGTVLPSVGADRGAAVLHSLAVSLADEGFDVVVAVDEDVAARLHPLPTGVLYAGRVPLSEMLRGCDVLVHHGGQGTTLTALAAGCPQVVLPKFDDQIDNAEAVSRAGAGVTLALDAATASQVAKHTRYVLEMPRFRMAAGTVAARISEQPSPTEIAERLARRWG